MMTAETKIANLIHFYADCVDAEEDDGTADIFSPARIHVAVRDDAVGDDIVSNPIFEIDEAAKPGCRS